MIGTVKVKNLSFEKIVTLRLSFDDWSTFEDHMCLYKKHRTNPWSSVRAAGLFDTFEFDVELEPDPNLPLQPATYAQLKLAVDDVVLKDSEAATTGETNKPRERAQFCMCFKCDHGEYWDSNEGQNYLLINERLLREKQTVKQSGESKKKYNVEPVPMILTSF